MDLNPLSPGQLSVVVMGATALIFIATYAGLRRFFVLPYLAVMQERRQKLLEAEGQLSDAEALISESQAVAEQSRAEALREADAILAEAREQAAADHRKRVDAATQEAAALLETGRKQLDESRSAALATLRSQAVECVGLACGQLIGKTDDRTIAEAVDKLMARHVRER